MKQKINLLSSLPPSKRPLEERKKADENDRKCHWKLGKEYFDGNRKQGYGGYNYDGRWKSVVQDFVKHYNLTGQFRVLDIGCAKGYLLHDFKLLNPKCEVYGIDISSYAVSCAPELVKDRIIVGNAKHLPFPTDYFDLVISINSLHNILLINEVEKALNEIERVSKGKAYISVGAWNNYKEKRNLDTWAVVATTYLHEKDWLYLFDRCKFTGDYYWFKP